jgi:hypothetical protein
LLISAAAAYAMSVLAPSAALAAAANEATEPDLSIATVVNTESHLPAWVQVVVASGSLYAADGSSSQVVDAFVAPHLPARDQRRSFTTPGTGVRRRRHAWRDRLGER